MTHHRFSPPSPELLTRKEAAAYLGGISPKTLAVWKSTKRYRLPMVKVGRLVRYRKTDLDVFLEERTLGVEENPDQK